MEKWFRKFWQLCSRLSERGGVSLWRLMRPLPSGRKCKCLHFKSFDTLTRIRDINAAAPNCECEGSRLSRFSPGPITGGETLVRFAFHPIHFNPKKGTLKPSLFSHAELRGCSIQRDQSATDDELTKFVRDYLALDATRVWKGVVAASADALRRITLEGDGDRAICAYDSGEDGNPAHGEFGWSRTFLEPGDANELRSLIWNAFGAGTPVLPSQYRSGSVFRALSADLRGRA
jgi:hypothetical protein